MRPMREPRVRVPRIALALGAGLLSAFLVAAPGLGAGSHSSPAIASCAYGSDVPGLSGFYASAVQQAADSYAAHLSGAGAATQGKARQAFAAAAAAYVYGLPQVAERATVKHFPHNEIISVAALADPSVRTVVAPNVDTAYTTSWLDLTDGPIVINVPDTAGRFYTFQFLDAFTNAFAYVGSGSTGTKAGAYVLVPPGYSAGLPTGATPIYAPSNTIWLLGRTLVKNAADLPAVKSLQQQYEATPLPAWESGTRQPPVVVDKYPPTIPKNIPTGSQFIATLNNEMNIDPPPTADDCALQAMAPAGVQVPHPTPVQTLLADTSDEAPALPAVASDPVVNAAISAGTAGAVQIIANGETKLNADSRGANNGWEILGRWVGAYGTRYLGRAIVATNLLAANTPEQTIYPVADTDVKGRTLNGAYRYTVRFPRGQQPPVRAFWSLTMYDPSYFLYANQINRYAVGDRTAGLHFARDGSLTIYVQHNPPASSAQRANWLPAPSGQFHLILRLYQPQPAALAGRWKPAPVLRSDESLGPRLSRVRIRPAVFRPARHGGVTARRAGRARVSYRDRDAGTVRFTILAVHRRAHCRGRRCTYERVVVLFGHRDRAGTNHFLLTGRAHGRRLRHGTYILRAAASGTIRTARFRIRAG
jgi:hypothetical protein